MKAKRYILVSKRSPLTYHRNESTGTLETALAPGGTANVVADMASLLGVEWISSAMTAEDLEVRKQHPDGLQLAFTSKQHPITVHMLEHDAQVFNDMQEIMTADVLWASNNTLWDSWNAPNFGPEIRSAWKHYKDFNADFLKAVGAQLEKAPGTSVLVQDYQLSVLPAMIRRRHAGVPVLLFIHIPWPAADYWSMLPKYLRTEFIEGMLGASVVGFFAARWCRNFVDCVRDLLPDAVVNRDAGTVEYRGHVTTVAAMPLGYSPQAIEHRSKALPADLQSWAADSFLFVHSGRTDPIKNGGRAITAFRLACENDEALRGRSRFLVRCNPNRLYVKANSDYLAQLEREAAHTNSRFGEELVRVVCENNVDHTLGCLQEADALLFNSTIDGQNLTVFEGSLLNHRHATVILSERAGTAEALASSVELINPFDIAELADTLAYAFHLTSEQRNRRAEERRKVVVQYGLPGWVDQQITALEDAV
ncbi:MAG: Alpha,alpha-trehalose-phosphate synthase [UDP-forming] (EC [uncultured Caballeronia sp.]|nr:MAG: Alpha,alpha-trehalose-phosphate synthase [UDP-forming] (EC [uncultured Caballeronia sp.]